jgi:hypothetical protein
MALRRPARYFEIGSGNSTKIAALARKRFRLATTITSIDPHPRDDVDALCDHLIREPVEELDPERFSELRQGDILFIDNSHRSFMNSDATVCFLDVLPRLESGVIVHVHDIFWPKDYPPHWANRHYSEQYLLASWLLAGGERLRVLLPNAFVSEAHSCQAALNLLWSRQGLGEMRAHARKHLADVEGVSFWCEVC